MRYIPDKEDEACYEQEKLYNQHRHTLGKMKLKKEVKEVMFKKLENTFKNRIHKILSNS